MFPDVLHTPRLILRHIVREDATAIFERYAQDPEVSRYTVWTPHRSLADAETFVADSLASPADTARTYALCTRDDAGLVGVLGLRRVNPHHLAFGYILVQRWSERGLMTPGDCFLYAKVR